MKTVKSLLAAVVAIAVMEAVPAMGQDYKEEYTVSTVVPAPLPWGLAAEATRPVYDAWRERIGADLVKQAEESVAKR